MFFTHCFLEAWLCCLMGMFVSEKCVLLSGLFFGTLQETDGGLSSCRMKYLWTPYVCMFTAFGVCSPDLWMTVFKWLKLRSIHPVVLVGVL